MCVTNTANRRLQPVSLTASNFVLSSSGAQDLFSNCLPESVPVEYARTDQRKSLNYPFDTLHQQDEKTRPKRKRKPQKPGKTAKNHERHFVVHNYHDHSYDSDSEDHDYLEDANARRRGGVSMAFPLKLHAVIDQVEKDGLGHVLSWQSHGRAFLIHKPKEFVEHVMPFYFRQSKLTSFQRQLNLYGFARLTRGPDAGGYYHELFLRGKPFLCKKMTRTKVKGTLFKAASSPEHEPDFYTMPPVVLSSGGCDVDFCDSLSSICNEYDDGTEGDTTSGKFSPIKVIPIPSSELAYSYHRPSRSQPPDSTFPITSVCYNRMQSTAHTDVVLDQAVDELFLQQGEIDNLDEFIHDWDPSFENNLDEAVNDDYQLGYLLEKLLG